MLNSVLPGQDLPWLPEKPGPLSRWIRALSLPAATPALLVLFGLDTLSAPLTRHTPLSNAYRVVACRD